MMDQALSGRLTLITPTPTDLSAFGVRSLSAFLKREGWNVRCIFLPGNIGRLQEGGGYAYQYDGRTLKQVLDLCWDSSLVGISFFTNYFDRALQLTQAVKRELNLPVIWGGIHASTKPRDSLQYADMVCVGEGELSLLELLERRTVGDFGCDIPGIWFREDGEVHENPLRPLVSDLDTLPFFDFSKEDHFVMRPPHHNVEPFTDEVFAEALPLLPDLDGNMVRIYKTMVMRGCPHDCTYCNVPTLKRLYQNDPTPFVRSRSVDHAIDELVYVKHRFPFVEGIQLFDDTFFARPRKFIEAFAQRYRREVGLPLYCQASPETFSESKLKLLLDCGLVYVEMGVQTGSAKTQKLFNRRASQEKILEGYRDRLLPPDYHVILNNPWDGEEDVMDTAKLLHQLPRPYGLAISSLVLYPGTKLHEKAVEEGRIHDEIKDVYLRPFYIPPKKYSDFLIYLMTLPVMPSSLISFLLKDSVSRTASRRVPGLFYPVGYALGEGLRLFLKGCQAVRGRDWRRLGRFFLRLWVRDPTVSGRKK